MDSSADMLERCRRRAASEGLDVVTHHQKMEELDLPRKFASIFLAGPTFTLLPDDDIALGALSRIRDHLKADGTAMIPLYIPEPTPPEQFGRANETTSPDGASLRVTYVSQKRDETHRTQQTVLRYERHRDDEHTMVERTWTLHWHTQTAFASLAHRAGLRVADVRSHEGDPVTSDATYFTFYLRPGR